MYRRPFFFSSFFCKKRGFFFRALFRVTDTALRRLPILPNPALIAPDCREIHLKAPLTFD
jgi:hypothetical protein